MDIPHDPDGYLAREHVSFPFPKLMATLDEAYELLKRGALRSEVLRKSGLSADQIDELKRRIQQR
jgi:hypothetical protein